MIAHECYGDGPEKVLILPGLPGDRSNYNAMLPGVDTTSFEWVIAEYRGTGLSQEQTGEFSLVEIIADLEHLVSHLGWQHLHVVGHSFGGFVAQRLAVEWRERIKSLVAVTPVPASGPPFDADGLAFLLQACRNDTVLLELARAFAGDRLPAAWASWLASHMRRICRSEAAEAYFQTLVRENFAADVVGLTTPCLVLIGEYDSLYTRSLMEETLLRWLPNARLEVLPACGHFPMLEVPLLFAAALERFFSQQN